MFHAFYWLPFWGQFVLLVILLIAVPSIWRKLEAQGQPLKAVVPGGILAFQFAWTRKRAQEMIDLWRGNNLIDTAQRQLRMDFGFLLVYPLLFSLATAMVADVPANKFAAVGIFISWAMLLALPLDALENLIHLRMLSHGASDPLAKLVGCLAGLKFTLLFAALGYVVLVGLPVVGARVWSWATGAIGSS